MKTGSSPWPVLLATLFAGGLFLAACNDPGPAEEAGREVDDAVEEARDALEDLDDEVEEALEDVEDELG